MLYRSVIVCFLVLLIACGTEPPLVAAPPLPLPTSGPSPVPSPLIVTIRTGRLTIPGTAYIDGRALDASPPATMAQINIWDNTPLTSVRCKLPHATQVTVDDTRMEDHRYLHVESGSCEGWVLDEFVSLTPQPPVGDLIP